jgi:hypothetical protein
MRMDGRILMMCSYYAPHAEKGKELARVVSLLVCTVGLCSHIVL